MMDLRIDETTRDLVINPGTNDFDYIEADESNAQSVRLTLQAWLSEFPLEETHGTDWVRFLGVKSVSKDEVEEVIRDGIMQEKTVAVIDRATANLDLSKRTAEVEFSGRLNSGKAVNIEVMSSE